MAIPAYLWMKDDGGADIKGAVDVQDREGSIEIVGFSHGLNIPVDRANGKITGKRSHSPMMIEKEFDSSSPYLYKAVATGQTLKSAEIRWYRINHAGQEEWKTERFRFLNVEFDTFLVGSRIDKQIKTRDDELSEKFDLDVQYVNDNVFENKNLRIS